MMIAFKQKSKDELYYQDKNGKWIKTHENKINSLWLIWMTSEKAKPQYQDRNGFTVFEYNEH